MVDGGRVPGQRPLRLLRLALGILLGILAGGGGLVWWHGVPPWEAAGILWRGAFGGLAPTTETLVKATPLILTGLSVAWAFRAGLFNIGAEGQLLLGGLSAAWVGFALALPAWIHAPLGLLGGALAGALWALVPAWLKVFRGQHEVLSTLLLNYVALHLCHYLVRGPLKEPSPMGNPQTPLIAPTAALPIWVEGSRLSVGFWLAVGTALGAEIYLLGTVGGFELRAVGANPKAAEAAGIPVGRRQLEALLWAGAFAGLAGAVEILGVHHRFTEQFSPGYGFDGITVALLGAGRGWGIVAAALFLGALRNGAARLQVLTDIPREFAQVLQALLILAVAWIGAKGEEEGGIMKRWSPRGAEDQESSEGDEDHTHQER